MTAPAADSTWRAASGWLCRPRCAAGVAKLVDATDLNPWSSARRETDGAELLKFGEASFLVIPSQARRAFRASGRC